MYKTPLKPFYLDFRGGWKLVDIGGQGPVSKRFRSAKIKAGDHFNRRRPVGSALGVHMVDIPRIEMRAQRRYWLKWDGLE
jgi:hypothetical protein